MKDLGRPATWLEMAGASQWHPEGAKVRIHPVVGPEGQCFALTLDRRWLCGTNGSVTLFHGLGAAVHFLQLAQVSDFEAGDPAELAGALAVEVECLCVQGKRSLQPCTCKIPDRPTAKAQATAKS